jgi:hypothetical protein
VLGYIAIYGAICAFTVMHSLNVSSYLEVAFVSREQGVIASLAASATLECTSRLRTSVQGMIATKYAPIKRRKVVVTIEASFVLRKHRLCVLVVLALSHPSLVRPPS